MTQETNAEGGNVRLSALLDEMHQRRVRTDAHVMDSAAAAIIRLQDECKRKGQLLADIFNHPDVELPPELNRRVDRMLTFGVSSNAQVHRKNCP